MRIRTVYKSKLKSELTPKQREEIAQWASMKHITPEDWLQRVKSLPLRCQPAIARMIWWDFWSDRVVAERWNHFDEWLKWDQESEDNPIPARTLAICLKKVGYPSYRVKMRLMAFQ